MRKLDISWNHRKHVKNIKNAWQDRAAEKARLIRAVLDDNPKGTEQIVWVYTTWSDGRFENKAHPWVKSNLELQLYVRGKVSSEQADQFMRLIRDRVDFALENLEVKNLDTDSVILYRGHPDLIFPTRTWDSVRLYWTHEWNDGISRALSAEIMENPKFSTKFSDRLRTHRLIMETGEDRYKGEKLRSYNLEEWTFFYNPEDFQFAVKNGPLRYVQYLLAIALMRYIRDKKEHPAFMSELPTNVIDRLEFIANESLTKKNTDEINTLRDIYAFFLYLYHEVQYRHFSESETEFILEDRDKLRDIRDMLDFLRWSIKVGDFFPTN